MSCAFSFLYTHINIHPRHSMHVYARYTLYAHTHAAVKISEAFQARFLLFPRQSLSFSLSLSFVGTKERVIQKRNKTEREGFRLRYFRVNAAPSLNKPTICVEDYLICYVFLTNHKHPLWMGTEEEWKGHSREPFCRPTWREQ